MLIARCGLLVAVGAGSIVKQMLKYRSGGESMDRVFHALADPSRRVIVERLSRGPASVSELAGPLPMSLAAVVQHLQVLETSGLIHTEKVGRVRTCTIDTGSLSLVEQWLSDRVARAPIERDLKIVENRP